MDPKIDIRFANEDDVDLILSFIKELAEYEKLLNEVVATAAGLKASLFGANSVAKVIFALHKGQEVGFALFFYNYSTFLGKSGLYIEDLYVRPEVRGYGIGRKMLAYLARYAKKQDCGRLEWWVLDWNKEAIGFYKKIGAKPMSDWTVYRLTGEELNTLADSDLPFPSSHCI